MSNIITADFISGMKHLSQWNIYADGNSPPLASGEGLVWMSGKRDEKRKWNVRLFDKGLDRVLCNESFTTDETADTLQGRREAIKICIAFNSAELIKEYSDD